jgi:hypothetical protein
LHGENIIPENHIESQLFKLVEMFEMEFSRQEFPEVYESLYAIQKGQTNSLNLINSNQLPEDSIKNICFEKGGASVLADGYLVAGKLSAEQERALFGYGVYLQLLDDIQDVKEDKLACARTMFSDLENNKMDEFVNQTINFGRIALDEMRCFKNVNTEIFLNLMKRSVETMAVESVGLNHQYFSEDYTRQLEKFSPIRFEFLRKRRNQSRSQRLSLFRKYFEQARPETITMA